MIEQLAILAPGLLGGSVAMAARARGAARRIVIWARRPEVRDALRSQPWCDAVAETPEEAVRAANLVVLAAPVEKIIELARQIAPALPDGVIVTDVGSVKNRLCRKCRAALPPHARFVGSHPMAGSQKTGWENGSAELFAGRTCFVTPENGADAQAAGIVTDFWRALGGRTVSVTPAQHDEIVANISHLPQALATNLCDLLAQKNPAWREHAGAGLRDTTRIAASDATMWIEIFQQNRDEVLHAIDQFQARLAGLRAAIDHGDWPEVRARLERGKIFRDSLG
ncbi:prephenate dehydrogenase/arogenate dehydrogenase family protein [Termitidicoccus mucosus]|uniref:Prephenate dehydrogenase n=1 Tax=Termitidicoccus mucosus TaxID=1184151 RepID=A0A178IFM0_9BACT|nr:prephenate dehydrogenase [Opitutaceae bacterium TSB47]